MQIHPSSFNHRVAKFDTSYMVYHEKVKTTGKIFVHDCTTVTVSSTVARRAPLQPPFASLPPRI